MPRNDPQRIAALPQVQIDNSPVQYQAPARSVDQTVMPRQSNTEIIGLMEGLKDLNPKLNRYLNAVADEDIKKGRLEGHNAGALELNPSKNLDNPITYPEGVSPAYKKGFNQAYREAVGANLGGQAANDLIQQYKLNRDKEGFNPEQLIKDFTAKEYAGITDPHMLGKMSQLHAEAIKSIRTDYRDFVTKQITERAKENSLGALSGMITANLTPQAIADRYHNEWLPTVMANGTMTRTEARSALMDTLQATSMRFGGLPELYDAFYEADKSGHVPALRDPKFREAVEKARAVATQQRDAKMTDADLQAVTRSRVGLEDALRGEKWDELTDDKLMQHLGRSHRSVFRTDDEFQAFRAKRDKAFDEAAHRRHADSALNNGTAWGLSEKDQKAALTRATEPYVATLMQYANDPSEEGRAQRNNAIRQIAGRTTQAGLVQAEPRLKEYFNSISRAVPEKGAAPTAQFNSAVDAYVTLKAAAPNLIHHYFDEDTRDVLGSFVAAREAGVEPQLALANAYAGVTPEAKARTDALQKDPEFVKKVSNAVHGVPTSTWRDLFGFKMFGTYPKNEDSMHAPARMEAIRWLRDHPNKGVDDAMKHVEEWTAQNFVYDSHTNNITRVPAGQANPQAAAAIASYTKSLQARAGKDAEVSLVYEGNNTYRVVSNKPDALLEPTISFQDIMRREYFNKTLTEQEAGALLSINDKARAGTLSADDVRGNIDLIAKARAVGALTPLADAAINRARVAGGMVRRGVVQSSMERLWDSTQGSPYNGLDNSRLPATADKGAIAQQFLKQGDLYGALTAMGEGVVLRATNDPGKDAGKNIGLGYNLKANAKNIPEDFRRAGIPAEHTKDIVEGRASITVDQAMRLYQVVRPRYEAIAKDFINSKEPGSWEKLPEQTRAVITDMAYQMGPGHLSQFHTAADAYIKGDLKRAGAASKVHYTTRAGHWVVDEGRHNMRMQMLHGAGVFSNAVQYVSSKPRTLVEAAK